MPRTTPATFMRPWQPDATLAALVGADPISRPEITKRLWAYIKRNSLQSTVNRRMIVARTDDFEDQQFRAFLDGASSCTMFELPKYVSRHISPVEG